MNVNKKILRRKFKDGGMRVRSHEVARIEAFSDAVFAFALTLLVVSLEVPKSFVELKEIMLGFPAFFIGALFLFMIWNEQNSFFRNYAMKDKTTLQLNGILLFVVLFYVYPIKFLFSVIFSNNRYMHDGEEHFRVETHEQNAQLLMIYAAGFIMVYLTFTMMYAHALRKRKEIGLNEIEIFQTRSFMYSRLLMVAIGFISVLITLTGNPELHSYAGLSYILIWPTLTLFFRYRSKLLQRKFDESELTAYAQLVHS